MKVEGPTEPCLVRGDCLEADSDGASPASGMRGETRGLTGGGWLGRTEPSLLLPGFYRDDGWGNSPFRGFVEPILALTLSRTKIPEWCPQGVVRGLLGQLASLLTGVSRQCLHRLYLDSNDDSRWEGFISRICTSSCGHVWEKYPGLQRLIETLCRQWSENSTEMLGRLEHDQDDLTQRFGNAAAIENLRAIETTDSDRHHDGKSVWVFHFEAGLRLVYKPRATALEAAWSGFLDWWRRSCPDLAPPGLQVLDRGSHGWVLFERPAEELDALEIKRYHRRLGGLLFLGHLFGMVDLHSENIIASARGPLLVDLECLFAPPWKNSWEPTPFPLELSGLLPETRLDANGTPYMEGGLACEGGHRLPHDEQLYYVDDLGLLRVESRQNHAARGNNLPKSRGESRPPSLFTKELLRGFRDSWEFFQANKTEVDHVLGRFRGLPLRVLLRSTGVYGQMLVDSVLPRRLETVVSMDVSTNLPGNEWIRAVLPDYHAVVQELEMQALARFDVPYFHAGSDGTDICSDGRQLGDVLLPGGALDTVRLRLSRLDSALKEVVCKSLGRCFGPGIGQESDDNQSSDKFMPGDCPGDSNLGDDVWQLCGELCRDLMDWAWHGPRGRLSWQNGFWLQSHSLRRHCLYDGDAGAAIFLAASGAVLGNAKARSMAAEYHHQLVAELLEAGGSGGWHTFQPGIGTGLGSVMLSALCLDKLLGHNEGREACLELLRAFSPMPSFFDPCRDLLGGLPGLLSVLSELSGTGAEHVQRAGMEVLSIMRDRCYFDESGNWRDGQGKLQVGGLAHGGGGIALALGRWARVDPSCEFPLSDWMRRALEPELSFLASAREGQINAWCGGAAGLLMCGAELSVLPGGFELAGELKRVALQHLLQARGTALDHLCCGNAGRFAAARVAGLPLTGLRRAFLSKRRMAGRFTLDNGPSVPRFGLFRGQVGIIYSLMQSIDSAQLPDLPMLTSRPLAAPTA